MSFRNHFSGHAKQYRIFRPRYPESLFTLLASLCATNELAWDCGTGSGQAAVALTPHFKSIIATDASENQIANAERAEGVNYRVAPAEDSGLTAASVDLITVAQAIHWFELGGFSAEANRVLKDRGVLAAWTYGLLTFNRELDEIIVRFHNDIVGEYWPFDRKLVESGYADLTLPLTEVPAPLMEMSEHWSFSDLIGYFNTWSAAKAYEKERGHNPLDLVIAELERAWGAPENKRTATWPLHVKIWRKNG